MFSKLFFIISLFTCLTCYFTTGFEMLTTDNTIGFPVTPNQFPWYVVVEPIMENGKSPYPCAGTIILSQWILASASCGYFRSVEFRIKFSAYDFNQPENVIYTKQFFPHYMYDWETSANNIALLRLPIPLQFTNYLQPIQLPFRSYKFEDHIGELVYYVGLIADDRVGGEQILRWSTKTMISTEICSGITNTFESELCAIDHGNSTAIPILCHPVPGSAIAVYSNNQWTQIGIASITGCNKHPSVFTNIPIFYDWIINTIQTNNNNNFHDVKPFQ